MNEKYEQTCDLAYALAHHVLIDKDQRALPEDIAEVEKLAHSIVTYIESDWQGRY